MLIGQNLRYYRNEAGFTQEQLAEGICHGTYISKIENGSISAPIETLSDLCRKLGITMEQLTQKVDEDKWLLLNNWLKEISEKTGDKKQFNHLTSVFRSVENPFLLSRYYIVLLRYYILIKDRQNAEVASLKVKNYENYITSETEYDHMFTLGLYEYHYGSLHTSHTHYAQAERIIEGKGIKKPELFYYMALTLSRLKKISLSTIYAYNALEMYNEEMNYGRSTNCNLLIGINFNLIEEYGKAEELFIKVINASGSHHMAELTKGRAYHNLGNIYSKQGQTEKAIEVLIKSLEFKEDINTKTNTIYLLAKEYFAIGEVHKGKEWISKGMHIAETTNDSDYQLKFSILYYQGMNEIESLQYHDLLKKAITHFKDTAFSFSCECAELLADIRAKEFHYKEAYEYLQLARNLMKSDRN